MKIVSTLLVSLLLTSAAFARTNEKLTPKCQSIAEEAAAKADHKMFGAEAGSCGSKLLHLGDQLETYLVCVSDETDPSEWIVTVARTESNKKGEIVKTCVVKYSGYAVDAATPDFE